MTFPEANTTAPASIDARVVSVSTDTPALTETPAVLENPPEIDIETICCVPWASTTKCRPARMCAPSPIVAYVRSVITPTSAPIPTPAADNPIASAPAPPSRKNSRTDSTTTSEPESMPAPAGGFTPGDVT